MKVFSCFLFIIIFVSFLPVVLVRYRLAVFWSGLGEVLAVSPDQSLLQAMARSPKEHRDTSIRGDIRLSDPSFNGSISLEAAIKKRRTERRLLSDTLSLKQLSQILWAAHGITEPEQGKRSIASAGALYPLEIFVVAGENGVEGVDSGVYQYLPNSYLANDHILRPLTNGDIRSQVAKACLGQKWMAYAPVIIVIAAEYERTTSKYGERGIQYVHIEVGHAGQNIFLQAVALNLGAGIVGAFDDEELKGVLKLPPVYKPLLLMPVGYVKI